MESNIKDADIYFETEMRLVGERVENIARQFIQSECCTDIRGAAQLLGLSMANTRKCARHWPLINLGERSNRYRIADIIKYRDSKTKQPKI
ncbi:MAG: hypothetical protein PHQ12_01145 [Chthoniobacteraceae bacterium]|nr:hypothetical protein [Chthoniobacteraceae bacterium]